MDSGSYGVSQVKVDFLDVFEGMPAYARMTFDYVAWALRFKVPVSAVPVVYLFVMEARFVDFEEALSGMFFFANERQVNLRSPMVRLGLDGSEWRGVRPTAKEKEPSGD